MTEFSAPTGANTTRSCGFRSSVGAVDNRSEIRQFLASRRAKVTPGQVGLPTGGGRRRVPGLRREEVATLAGVSTDWYIRLEKGHINGVSAEVLDAVARALQLDEADRNHLFNLARAAWSTRTPRRHAQPWIRPSVQRLLDAMVTMPAFVRNGRLDVLAINPLGHALYSPAFEDPIRPVNLARFNFLDQRSEAFYPDWEHTADMTVALLRTEAGRDPYDKDLTDLVGELATRSDAFRTRWAADDVRLHRTGTQQFHHPVVGYLDLDFDAMDHLDLDFEAMELPADIGLTVTAYSAEPGTPSADALTLLASWMATTTEPAPLPTGKD